MVKSGLQIQFKNWVSHFNADKFLYEQLRMLEALYLIARNMGYSHPKHQLIMNLIQKPNFYGSAKKANQEKIRQILSEIEVLIANKDMQWTTFRLRYASLQNSH